MNDPMQEAGLGVPPRTADEWRRYYDAKRAKADDTLSEAGLGVPVKSGPLVCYVCKTDVDDCRCSPRGRVMHEVRVHGAPEAGLGVPDVRAKLVFDDGRICPCGAMNEKGHTNWCENTPGKASGGGKLTGDHYYRVQVAEPMSPELQPYTAECADIIEALGMTFNEGEAFKALWRLAAGRQGRGKTGGKPQYDADKVAHYGARVAAQTKKAAQ